MPERSPCIGCEHELENKKKFALCVNCTDRLDYVAELEGWNKETLEKTKKEIEQALKRRKSRYCDTPGCQGLHYAKNKCKSCYRKMRRGTLGKPNMPSVDFHVRIISPNAKELARLVKAIAEYEDRTLSSQLIQFVEMGVVQWLREHNME